MCSESGSEGRGRSSSLGVHSREPGPVRLVCACHPGWQPLPLPRAGTGGMDTPAALYPKPPPTDSPHGPLRRHKGPVRRTMAQAPPTLQMRRLGRPRAAENPCGVPQSRARAHRTCPWTPRVHRTPGAPRPGSFLSVQLPEGRGTAPSPRAAHPPVHQRLL